MIKHISLETASVRLQNLWLDIWRQIQKHIEHTPVINGEPAANVSQGHVLYASANNTVRLAQCDGGSPFPAAWVGVSDDSVAGPGDQFVMATDGYRLVRFNPALNLTDGDHAYVSATAGEATNVEPGFPNFISQIGIICDASIYNGVVGVGYYPYAMVLLNRCCDAPGRQQ